MSFEEAASELTLPVHLTIRHMAEIREVLMSAMAESTTLSIDVPHDATVDISFVQLLVAAQIGARSRGQLVQLSAPPTGSLRTVLEEGGFLEEAAGLGELLNTKGQVQ